MTSDQHVKQEMCSICGVTNDVTEKRCWRCNSLINLGVPMTSEDNATQGWRKKLNPLIGLYDLELDGRHIAMGLFGSDADLLLATLQRQGWQVCPVCEGRGNVRNGFYIPNNEWVSTSTAPETCQRCNGLGTIAALERPSRVIEDQRDEAIRQNERLRTREAELRAEIESLERSEGRESERANFMVEAAERNLARAEASEAREAALVEALRGCESDLSYIRHRGNLAAWQTLGFNLTGEDVEQRLRQIRALISPPGLSEGG